MVYVISRIISLCYWLNYTVKQYLFNIHIWRLNKTLNNRSRKSCLMFLKFFFTVQTYPSIKPNQGKTIVIPPQDICCETIIILDFATPYKLMSYYCSKYSSSCNKCTIFLIFKSVQQIHASSEFPTQRCLIQLGAIFFL